MPLSTDAASRGGTRVMQKTPSRPVLPRTIRGDGPRIWALPDKNLGWWILREDDTGGSTGLTVGVPTIFIPELSTERKVTVGECCRDFVASRLRDRWQEDLFNLLKRMMTSGILLIAGIVGLRLLPAFDFLLLAGAMGYTAYAGVRYGGRLLGSLEAAHRPYTSFTGEPFAPSKLLDRIAQALEFRRRLPPEKRGESPDDELLDANAYRKMIRDGVTTREEICALGHAVQQRLDVTTGEARKIGDLARTEGLDPESAALYRDLALAAVEIEYDAEMQ